MTRQFSRTRRIADQIQKELAQVIQQELKDPRVSWLTISAVEVSKDLAHATVYFTVLNDEPNLVEIQKVLGRVSGFLRHELGRRMRMRTIPELHFKYDDSLARGSKLSALIDAAVEADKKSADD